MLNCLRWPLDKSKVVAPGYLTELRQHSPQQNDAHIDLSLAEAEEEPCCWVGKLGDNNKYYLFS